MAHLQHDMEPGDILIVPQDSGAKITVGEKSGRRTRVIVESAKPVRVLKAREAESARAVNENITRPAPSAGNGFGRPGR